VIERLGHDPRSAYAERSATFAARALAGVLDANPDGGNVPPGALAGQLGLGSPARIAHALERLGRFGLATTYGGGLALHRKWPPITARHVARLPGHLQVLHALESDRMTA
jgi:hypothetical protein